MIPIFNVNDEVLVFGKYEGTIIEVHQGKVLLYCPEFDAEEPYLVVATDYVILLSAHELIS